MWLSLDEELYTRKEDINRKWKNRRSKQMCVCSVLFVWWGDKGWLWFVEWCVYVDRKEVTGNRLCWNLIFKTFHISWTNLDMSDKQQDFCLNLNSQSMVIFYPSRVLILFFRTYREELMLKRRRWNQKMDLKEKLFHCSVFMISWFAYLQCC